MPALFVIGFFVLWYFTGFWLALGLTILGVIVVFKPDLVYAAIGLGLLYICVLMFLAIT